MENEKITLGKWLWHFIFGMDAFGVDEDYIII